MTGNYVDPRKPAFVHSIVPIAPTMNWGSFMAHLPAWIGGAASISLGALDLWHFKDLGTGGDLAFILGGLGAFGVSAVAQPASTAAVALVMRLRSRTS